ncbi:hypothetical protein CYY_001766 [Polysphondylium violaceum]|uniref:TPR-like protein n=1 Tax=Polysphondylium violaceum TaxID=133409 RepID=A0A8J4PZ95_9MYCE|nr:hypothetical protein CYY_001766 [Polysphondylium violaceum]
MKAFNFQSLDQQVLLNHGDKIKQLYEALEKNPDQYENDPILKDIITCAYNIVLGSTLDSLSNVEFIKDFFKLDTILKETYSNIEDYFNEISDKINSLTESEGNQMIILLSGITFLNLYIQVNWTGPTLQIPKEFNIKNNNRDILSLLEVDGETFYVKSQYPLFLYLAKICLIDNYAFLSDGCQSACLWSCRAMMYYQRSLANMVPTFKSSLNERFQIVFRFYSLDAIMEWNDENQYSKDELIDLATQIKIEQSLVFNYYKQLNKFRDAITEAKEISGLDASLTGALGKRTRFQTFDTAQLVLEVKSSRAVSSVVGENEPSVSDPSNYKFKREVTNDDPTLLSKPTLVDKEKFDTGNLRVIDQALCLIQCLNVKNQNTSNGLITEEMLPFVQKTLEHSNNWIVHSLGLLIKSRIEIHSSKTSERAVLQIQALVDQYDDETSPASERMRMIYALDYPSRWDMEREVAEKFIGIGAAASAFDIFERLEMWDDAIQCLTFMGKHARSEELVLARIAIQPTPELYCVLGDLKNDAQHYLTSWELSKKKYARAQRSLGKHYLMQEKWNEAIEHFSIALAINPLFPASWFNLGCSAMRIEKWDVAVNAFTRVVSMEPEEGEAWANLASVYMYQNKLEKASLALQEGIKHKRDNWKMWENFLYCSMGISDFQNSITAVIQIFELNNKKVDLNVLQGLADHVVSDKLDKQGINGRKLEKLVSELFGRITSKLTNSADLWKIYSSYHYQLGNSDKAIDLQQKACRSVESAGWENSKPHFEKVALFTKVLCNLYLEFPNTSYIYSAKLKVKGILKKVETSFSDTETFKDLQNVLKQLEEKEQSLI